MKILVLSDTHGDIYKAEEAIRQNSNIDLVIHLGDFCRDAIKLSRIFQGIPFEYIHGNCDFAAEGVQPEKLLELCGKKVFITHGHKYSVKWDYNRLFYKAEEMNADMLLFGHTHIPVLFGNCGCCILNPGSTSNPRGGASRSYAIIEINNGKVDTRLCLI